jgi:uncharacterized protein (TIGR03118 family)
VMSFGDSSLPSNFSVFNVQDIGGMVYAAYADVNGGTGGYIDVFKEDGTFVKTLIKGQQLNQPWGVTLAPSDFGPLSNTLLISNNSTPGTINGFDPMTGKFMGTIRDQFGFPMFFVNLWGIEFGGGATSNGAANQLFVAVGPGIGAQAQDAGTFSSIIYNPKTGRGHGFGFGW